MKTLLFSIIAIVAVSVTFGILIISGTINISSIPQIQNKSIVTQSHGLPTLPAMTIYLNGSASQSPVPKYDVKAGQNITLSIHIVSDPKNIPVILSANPKLGFPKASGINWYLYYYQLGSPKDSFLNVTIAKDIKPGEYPMEIDANTQAIPNVNYTGIAYFILAVIPNYDPASSIALNLSTNSSSIKSGQTIGIDMSLYNMMPHRVLIQDTYNYSIHGLILQPCVSRPLGMEILYGDFLKDNAAQGTPLALYSPGERLCMVVLNPDSYQFEPLSSNATLECNMFSECGKTIEMRYHFGFDGSWDANGNFHKFKDGWYTVVAGDEWGHVAIQHFAVGNQSED